MTLTQPSIQILKLSFNHMSIIRKWKDSNSVNHQIILMYGWITNSPLCHPVLRQCYSPFSFFLTNSINQEADRNKEKGQYERWQFVIHYLCDLGAVIMAEIKKTSKTKLNFLNPTSDSISSLLNIILQLEFSNTNYVFHYTQIIMNRLTIKVIFVLCLSLYTYSVGGIVSA